MADFKYMFQICNKVKGTTSDFTDGEGLKDFLIQLKHDNLNANDYEVYRLQLRNVGLNNYNIDKFIKELDA